MSRKFPTWWQALILFVGGIVIALSSCAGMLSGIGGGQSKELGQLYVFGFFAGIAAFIAGIVLFIVVAILALVRPPDDTQLSGFALASPESGAVVTAPHAAHGTSGVVISRATHPQLFPDAPVAAAASSTELDAALARLHIAIFVSMLASGVSLWRTFALQQWSPYARHYSLTSALSVILSQVPYAIVLIRTWRRPDRPGLALAIAAGSVYVLSTWRFFTLWQHRAIRIDPTFWVHAALNVLIIVLAILVKHAAALRKADAELLISFFFGVLVYTSLITFLVRYLSIAWH